MNIILIIFITIPIVFCLLVKSRGLGFIFACLVGGAGMIWRIVYLENESQYPDFDAILIVAIYFWCITLFIFYAIIFGIISIMQKKW